MFHTNVGKNNPLGISKTANGINFAIFAEAHEVILCLFINEKYIEIPLNRTDKISHIEVLGLNEGEYFYKFDGVIRQDPYAKYFSSSDIWGKEPKIDTYLKAKIAFDKEFKFTQNKPNLKKEDLIIYEMHVRAFTQDKSSDVKNPGSFLGIIEKIPYLKSLGINAIELLPIYEFDECSYNKISPVTKKRLYNFWGYSPISFFSIMKRYGSVDDFKTLVDEAHKNEIEVILDVVYNHTSNPIEDSHYYMLDEQNNYLNFSGCGNTINANDPITSDLILNSLIYFSEECKVDGFRFDLASILTQDEKGQVLDAPLLLEKIKNEKKLSNIKMIAEPWNALGLYQVGKFYKYGNFSEWNDKFRDSFRKFFKGDDNQEKDFLTSILGSQHLYPDPKFSINYVTCHDGFTLYDLVSYNNKHNLANAENNQDGNNQNDSYNYGFEGKSDNPKIEDLRKKQMKNFLLALMISQGIPMIQMGIEYAHTKDGNNNTWCQDNELSYFLWNKDRCLFKFLQKLIEFRKNNKILTQFFPKKNIVTKIEDKFVSIEIDDLYLAFNTSAKEINISFLNSYEIVIDTSNDDIESNSLHKSYKIKPQSSILLKKSLN